MNRTHYLWIGPLAGAALSLGTVIYNRWSEGEGFPTEAPYWLGVICGGAVIGGILGFLSYRSSKHPSRHP